MKKSKQISVFSLIKEEIKTTAKTVRLERVAEKSHSEEKRVED